MIFSDAANQKILSSSRGEVSFTGFVSGYGLTVMIKQPDGTVFSYSGFKEVNVSRGQKIEAGTLIGKTGRFSEYNREGILYSVQVKGQFLKFDMEKEQFYQS
jgi:septal ring factor EnvC (AmiA/AmiB activator)